MAYTLIPKPTGAFYTNVRNGFPLYDDTATAYDDTLIFFDGDTTGSYTNIGKPSASTRWVDMTIPWAAATVSWQNEIGYINIVKPT